MLRVISSATLIRISEVCLLPNIQGKVFSKKDPPMNSRLAHSVTAESRIASYIVAPILLELLLRILKLTYIKVP